MNSQIRFVMHPDDEREFEQLLLADESIRFIEGPRWKTQTPLTSRSLAEIRDDYCIIWSPNDIAKLKAEYIPTCNDWYCRSEHATIRFWRSEIAGPVITEGRISVGTIPTRDFPASAQECGEEIRYCCEAISRRRIPIRCSNGAGRRPLIPLNFLFRAQ